MLLSLNSDTDNNIKLSKDVIIYILRILCKFSTTDSKNTRLVTKWTAADQVIFTQMKSHFNKFVKHDLANKTLVMDIPNYVLPSDERIESQICKGLFDDEQNYDPSVMHDNIVKPAGPSNKFKTMLSLYPQTDFFMTYYPSEDRSQNKNLNLNRWEIFNYPIINVSPSFPIINMYVLMALEDPIPRAYAKVGALRMMIDSSHEKNSSFKVSSCQSDGDTSKLMEFRVNRMAKLIEAFYFHEEIPETVTLLCGTSKVSFKPKRRYLYLGMLLNDGFSDFGFLLPNGLKFKVVAWAMPDQFNEIEYTSTFYDETNTHKIKVRCRHYGVVLDSEPINKTSYDRRCRE